MSRQTPIAEWTAAETDVLARATLRAPSVHNIQPWRLEIDGERVLLTERQDVAVMHHDPAGRDRTISCGTALLNLELGMRALGRRISTSLLPDPMRPEVVATVTVRGHAVPQAADLHLYSAISRRRSYRLPFNGVPVSDYDLADLLAAAGVSGVRARPVRDEIELGVVADQLERAAHAYQHNIGYQRELSMWTIRDERSHRHGAGIAASCIPPGSLPWAGLIRPATALPDRMVLRRRLADETLLVFVTDGDSRADHLHAGYALERAWLTAVDAGLAASVLTQPLHLGEFRAALRDELELRGYPQALLRVGHASGAAPPSPRRGVGELLR
ncbi:Acg family FMN-binding oxidoreductase [Amycolatopsis sp. NPDC059657]|uniref:Acg family FMN-binding oxidoreductase n=1 Tax=Amycolatopsis sp. NPDC059657 TaxID=3346899 RepID=UPI00366BE203